MDLGGYLFRVEDVEASIEGPTRLVVRLGAQSDGGSCGLYRRLYSIRHSIVYTIAFGTVLNRCLGALVLGTI